MISSATPLPPTPLVIVLVDENKSSTAQFKHDLEELGYIPDVVQIKSREELRAWLSTHTADVIVANHRVADFCAIDVLMLLEELHSDIPVVLLSAPEFDAEKGPLLRAGALDFILPSEIRRIVPIVEQQIRLRKEFWALRGKFHQDEITRGPARVILEALKQRQAQLVDIVIDKLK